MSERCTNTMNEYCNSTVQLQCINMSQRCTNVEICLSAVQIQCIMSQRCTNTMHKYVSALYKYNV